MTYKCPQCHDNKWFSQIGIKRHLFQIHEESVKEANEYAKPWATSDEINNCSLGWNKLWLVHFSEKYESLIVEKRGQMISEYEDACYKKPYDNEEDICSYHEELRHSTS
jgi:GMP synthase-like glutamine amidotransferase